MISWTTFDGRRADFTSVSHQHLSNTVWFLRVLWGEENPVGLKALEERFEGELLPYRPKKEFQREIAMLREKGLLTTVKTVSGETELIVWKGEIIGEIEV